MDVEEVQGNIIRDDFDMPKSTNREQAAPAEDEEECMPEGPTVD